MAYVRLTETHKQLKTEVIKLQRIQHSALWKALMRAICYPHKGMMYSHNYFISEWFKLLCERGEEQHFFDWVEAYRQHCAALPIHRQSIYTKEINAPALFTRDSFRSLLTQPNFLKLNLQSNQSVVATTEVNIYTEIISLFLLTLYSTDVFLPKELAPTFDDVLSIYTTLTHNSGMVGILMQRENRSFYLQEMRATKWYNPSYPFTDPLDPSIEVSTALHLPRDYNQLLLNRIDEQNIQVGIFDSQRTSKTAK